MAVLYEVRDRIALMSFNRPEKHNALRDEDIASLVDALQRFDVDDEADVGILHGEGRSFSSGGDVNDRLQRSMDEGSTSERTTEYAAFTHCTNWKPVIAAVHGYCLGHALGTALRDAYARHRQRRRAYSLYNELRMLDDHSLRDLGIDRSEITSVASEAAGIAEQSRARFL